ncbi:MAG TPA: uroporphyrinogen-III C-methyltransferase [Gammaproteobacteria bacterium]
MTKPDTPDDDGRPATEGEAAAESTTPKPEQGPAPDRKPPRVRGAYVLSSFAFLCAVCAIAASGYLWWQYRTFNVYLDQADADAAGSIQEVRAALSALEADTTRLESVIAETRSAIGGVGERVDAIPGRLLDLEERVNATQGVSQDASRRWMLAEAEYYLTVANTELQLAGRWDGAIRALELADRKLLELASPTVAGVRERISAELQSLRVVSLPDVEGHSFTLSRLAESGRTLPIRADLPGAYASDGAAPAAELSGFDRVWDSLKSAIAGMVSIERRIDPVERALSSEEQALVRQQLELELSAARLGLVSGQAEVFDQSLAAAIALLERHFDTAEVVVESSLALLAEMRDLDIAPARPDISGSLEMLRTLADRED